jgi:hypothetical protein
VTDPGNCAAFNLVVVYNDETAVFMALGRTDLQVGGRLDQVVNLSGEDCDVHPCPPRKLGKYGE